MNNVFITRVVTTAAAAFLVSAAVPFFGYAEVDLNELEKKLPEVKVQETVINITPKMRFYLPNGSLDMALSQKYEKMGINFSSRYDFVDSFMGFTLDFLYDFSPYSVGINLLDKVDFNEIFSNTRYLQRTQSIGPFAQYALRGNTSVRGGIRFENTYTDSVASNFVLDSGRNIIGEIGIGNDTIVESTATPRGGKQSLGVAHSFVNWGSDYDYTQAEAAAHQFFYTFDDQYFEYELQAGYPLAVTNRPLTSVYYAGGYRMLKGYNFKEFSGDALIYNAVIYHVPITGNVGIFGIPFSILTWDLFAESLKIGDKTIYSDLRNFKWSLGTGFGYKLTLFKQIPVQLEISFDKALEGRLPIYYFTVSTAYYTWGKE